MYRTVTGLNKTYMASNLILAYFLLLKDNGRIKRSPFFEQRFDAQQQTPHEVLYLIVYKLYTGALEAISPPFAIASRMKRLQAVSSSSKAWFLGRSRIEETVGSASLGPPFEKKPPGNFGVSALQDSCST